MPRRSFLPPALCDVCRKRPSLGDTMTHTGTAWVCPACLADVTPGDDALSKAAHENVQSDEYKALSRRARASGDIENAEKHQRESNWHGHAVVALKSHGFQRVKGALVAGGEASASPGFFKDTLADPGLTAIESSEARGKLLLANDVVALGIDIANTISASNTMEKLLAHELALAHKLANEQASMASRERDPAIQVKRLQVAARMMTVFQQGVLTLHKLRTGGTQNVVVQHVYVADGGQAVVGAMQAGECDRSAKN